MRSLSSSLSSEVMLTPDTLPVVSVTTETQNTHTVRHRIDMTDNSACVHLSNQCHPWCVRLGSAW